MSAIKRLQHAYGYYADRKMWDDVAALFAEDATMEIGLQGVDVGRASIRRALNASGSLARGEVNDHVHLQTIVSVGPVATIANARGTDLGLPGTPGSRALLTKVPALPTAAHVPFHYCNPVSGRVPPALLP